MEQPEGGPQHDVGRDPEPDLVPEAEVNPPVEPAAEAPSPVEETPAAPAPEYADEPTAAYEPVFEDATGDDPGPPLEELPAAAEELAPAAEEFPPTAASAVFVEPSPPAPAAVMFTPQAVPGEPAVDDEIEEDDEEEDDGKKGISFATKALVIAAAWVLLVLFLIGQFEKDNDPGLGPVGLDQPGDAATDEVAAGEAGEEPVDVDGDGKIEAGEPGYRSGGSLTGAAAGSGGAAGSGDSGTAGGSTGGSSGGGSGSTGGSGGGTGSGDAGVQPLPGGGTSTGGSTTTTAKPSAGGTTNSTTTTTSGSGSGGGTPTTASPTTTTTSPGTPAPEVVTINRQNSSTSEFSRTVVTLERGQSIRFVNQNAFSHTLDVPGSVDLVVPANGEESFQFNTPGPFTIECKTSGHKGSISVTVKP